MPPLLALQRQIGNAAMSRLVVQRECQELSWMDFQERGRGKLARTVYRFGESGNTFTVRFLGDSSWRGGDVTSPYDRIVNECAASDFSNGGTYSTGNTADRNCAASQGPTNLTATQATHCQSRIQPAVTAANRRESMRLLRHEQYHMNLACALTDKANTARANGSRVAIGTLRTKDRQQSRAYDNATSHGCIQAAQTRWEGIIDGGLPGVTF